MIGNKVSKMIRKYAKLRGAGNPALSVSILRRVYERGSQLQRRIFRKDMENYFLAIEKGLIKKGESYVLAGFANEDILEVENKKSKMRVN